MKRIYSGIKPTGELHLGNYLGAIKNWIPLQDKYECIFGIVDYHAMTAGYDKDKVEDYVLKIAANYLACGLDPEKSVLMIQSAVPEHTELAWILNCLTPISWLERVPTFKEKAQQHADNLNMGLMDYPVLMTADIIIYKAEAVPVGEDQLPHIELCREILRRFNAKFGTVFPEPKSILGKISRIKGLDGSAKMGKSLGNCIYLIEAPKEIKKKINKGITDPARVLKTDPGDPEKCNLYDYHRLFSDEEKLAEIREGCTTAGIGCVKCKKWLYKNVMKELEPIQSKYSELIAKPDYLRDIYTEGSKKARKTAIETMEEVRDKISLNYRFMKK
ncbi:MAG: tryptophan--tRNA ligase [Candidatus Cloacimonadota bacterium]|nr:MAG: tryptophan--tRNA ligase [Candidatus Cloacimonadota bacterium]